MQKREKTITIPSKKQELPRILNSFETWTFSLAGYICWMMTANGANNALGIQSLWAWVPGVIFGTLFLLQIKQVGVKYPEVSGGMPAYITRLFDFHPTASKYANWAYYIGWAGVPAIYPFILSSLIEYNLQFFGIQINMLPIQLLLLTLGFIIGMISTKALAAMQMIFTIPALLITGVFIFFGVFFSWNGTITPVSQPTDFPGFESLLIWLFFTSYITYTGESTAVFTSESINPKKTLQSLNVTSFLKPFILILGPLFLGLTVDRGIKILPSQAIEIAGESVFGGVSSNIGTGLVVSSLLLSTTLTVALAPRVLFQLSKDKLASPLFTYLTRNGTPRVGIVFTFIIALITFFIGSMDKILIGSGAAFLMSIVMFHVGVLRKRKTIGLKMPIFTLLTVVFEIFVLLSSIFLVNPVAIVLGLVSPFLFIAIDTYIMPTKFVRFLHENSTKMYRFLTIRLDSISTVVFAVLIIMVLSSGISWTAASYLNLSNYTQSINLYISASIILAFLAVAIVAISIIPQVIKVFKQKNTIEIVNKKLGETLVKYTDSINRLEDLAFVDQLTRLGNTNQATLDINNAIKHFQNDGETYCFCIIDIDRFKIVNDSLGYAFGDTLLKQIGNILGEFQSDTISAYRIGSDEFGLLIRKFRSKKTNETLIKRISEEISAPLQIQDRTVFITSCIGFVYGSSDYHSAEHIYQAGNIAKHKAKNMGTNSIQMFSKILKQEVIELEKLERELRSVVSKKAFEVFFQPIYNIKTNKIEMVESLIRWFTPEGNSISPSLFIPLAEETGLISEITFWSIEESFRKAKELMKSSGRTFKISVNISPVLFQDVEFPKNLKTIADRLDFDLTYMIVEITEYMILKSSDEVLSRVKELQKLGVHISLDDFGTGYSNLKYLNNLKIDELKIDRSFTQNLITESGRHIVEMMTELSSRLGLEVVFEGVETPEQLKTIREVGGDYIQGFIFSPAIKTQEFDFDGLESKFASQYLKPNN